MMVVFFDIDGTLIDHHAAERAGAVALHELSEQPVPIGEFLLNWSAALEHYFTKYLKGDLTYNEQGRARVRDVLGQTLTDETADRLFSEYLVAYEGAWSLFPDVRRCLDKLSGHRLGIISNGRAFEQRNATVPRDFSIPSISAGSTVADWSACSLDMPSITNQRSSCMLAPKPV
jgi:putative hydrolase of the HAD superfamily